MKSVLFGILFSQNLGEQTMGFYLECGGISVKLFVYAFNYHKSILDFS